MTTTIDEGSLLVMWLGAAKPRFPLGQILVTRNAHQTLERASMLDGLKRHATGDWGEVCAEDRGLNDEALTLGNRLLSVYRDANAVRFWIITEADRSATTILLPEDY